jgi:hypothetical protein
MRRAVVATAVLLVAVSGVSCESPPASDAESLSATSEITRLQVERAEGTVAITGGVLLDLSDGGRGTADVQDAVVVFRGDTILAVGKASEISIPADALLIDLTP